jgi:hypothetical protein
MSTLLEEYWQGYNIFWYSPLYSARFFEHKVATVCFFPTDQRCSFQETNQWSPMYVYMYV